MKTIVILLLVVNLLAAFFFMPAKNDSVAISISDQTAASKLALLSEGKVELESSVVEINDSINIVEAAPLVDAEISRNIMIEPKVGVSEEQRTAVNNGSLEISKRSLELNIPFQCVAVQGIKTIDAANRLKTKLASLNATNLTVAASDQVSDQYWVYLGPYKTKQKAINANVRLRERNRVGYFFTNEQVRNSISLGVFSSSLNAQRLQTTLNKENFRSKIWVRKLVSFVLTAEISSDDIAILTLISSEGYMPSTCE